MKILELASDEIQFWFLLNKKYFSINRKHEKFAPREKFTWVFRFIHYYQSSSLNLRVYFFYGARRKMKTKHLLLQ